MAWRCRGRTVAESNSFQSLARLCASITTRLDQARQASRIQANLRCGRSHWQSSTPRAPFVVLLVQDSSAVPRPRQ
jgi:hypothetical protein